MDEDEVTHFMLEPDLILPSQYFHRQVPMTGERALLLAILNDAINCFFRKDPKTRFQAEIWLAHPDESFVTSYRYICSAFSIDPDHLLLRLRKQRSSGIKVRHRVTINIKNS